MNMEMSRDSVESDEKNRALTILNEQKVEKLKQENYEKEKKILKIENVCQKLIKKLSQYTKIDEG